MVSTIDIIQFEEFIIQTGLIGLGLLLALYAIVVPNFKEQIMNKQITKFESSYKYLAETVKRLQNDVGNSKLHDSLNVQSEDLKLYSKPPFWIIWGVLLDVIFLSLSTLLPLFDIFGVKIPYLTTEIIVNTSELLLIFGIIFFVAISFIVFIELKEMLTGEFEDKIEKSKRLLEQAQKLEKDYQRKNTKNNTPPLASWKKRKQTSLSHFKIR